MLLGQPLRVRAAGGRLPSRTREVDSDQPDGTFVGTSPPAGSRAVLDQVITILVSNGSHVPAPAPAPDPRRPGSDRRRRRRDGGGGDGGGTGPAAAAAVAGTAD